MDSEIHDLLVQIRDTISSYMNDGLSFELAKKKYTELLSRYKELETVYSSSGGSYIKGLLYQHNIKNFSKLTELYSLDTDLNQLYSLGDAPYTEKTIDIITKLKDSIIPGEVSQHFLEKQDVLTYTLFLYPFQVEDTVFYFTSVSSSTFFSKEKFKHLAEIIELLYYSRKTKPVVFNYVDDIMQSMERFIEMNPHSKIYADIYVFDTIANVFGHMSQVSIRDISKTIIEVLQNEYPVHANVLILSFSNYVVLHDMKDSVDCNRIKFRHNRLPVTYKSLRLSVDKSKPLNLILDEIYNFEQYILQGDVQV